jgi:hypothetical protein
VDGEAAGLAWVKRAPVGHKGAAHEERQAACDCSLAPLPARARGGTGVASCGSVPPSLSLSPLFQFKWVAVRSQVAREVF